MCHIKKGESANQEYMNASKAEKTDRNAVIEKSISPGLLHDNKVLIS